MLAPPPESSFTSVARTEGRHDMPSLTALRNSSSLGQRTGLCSRRLRVWAKLNL